MSPPHLTDKKDMKFVFVTLLFLSSLAWAQEGNQNRNRSLDLLARDTQKILDLIVRDSIDPQIQIETDKLRLLRSIQQLEFFNLQCDHVVKPPLEKIQRLEGGDTFTITSDNPVLSKVGIDLIHLRTLKNRKIYAQGELNGEAVYFKLVIDENNKVSLTYFPVNENHIPRAMIVPDPGKTDPDKKEPKKNKEEKKPLEAQNTFNGKRVVSKIVDPNTGKVRYIFEGDGDDAKIQANLANEKDTRVLTVSGTLQEGNNTGTVSTDLSIKDDDKKNEVYARAIVISEGDPEIQRFGYRYHGENIQLGAEQAGETTTLTAKGKKKIGKTTLEGNIKSSDGVETTQGKVTYQSEDKKTKITGSTSLSEVDLTEISGGVEKQFDKTKVTGGVVLTEDDEKISSGIEQKMGKAKLTGAVVLNNEGEKFSTGIETPLGDKTKAKANVDIQSNDDVVLKAQIVREFTPEKGKASLTAGADLVLRSEGEDSYKPQITLARTLDDEGKWEVKSIQSAEIRGGEVTRIKGRAELNHKNRGGSLGIYVEGSVYPSSDKIPEMGAGVKFSHDLGGDGSHLELLKVHKHYKTIDKGDQHIGYYFTWRYECNKKKKKVRIHKQRKPLFGSPNLNSLFSYALPKSVPMPMEVYSPEGISLEKFCK